MRTHLQSTMLSTVAAFLIVAALLTSCATALPRSVRQALAEDTWGPWSDEWSVCSRSCGGGVSYQERKCIPSREGARPNCMGPDVNYRSCNIQDCPEGAKDFREEQCSRYDNKAFQGSFYTWVPYLGAENKCELNCMPKGKHFYYRLADQVINGTRCEAEKLDVCVNGECMKVGCDSMLGSDAEEDVCRECNGNGSSCKTISGVFKRRKLPFGYNDILVLPAGAVNIHITEVKPSNNFLALRSANGKYYINGNFSIDFPQPFSVAGTVVNYERQFGAPFYGAELFHALGPISEPLFVVLVTQERNYGVAYNYSVPLDNKGAKPDTYSWLFGEFTSCTRTCGGGYQLREVWCARVSDFEQVPEYLCDPALKPMLNHSCSMVPCPPGWFAGDWSACSASCGEGQQVRLVSCQQVMHGDQAEVIHDSFCETGTAQAKPRYLQECVLPPCPDWTTGDWSQCSVTCGRGVLTRMVTCGSNEILADSSCPADTRPEGQSECHMGPCENVQWLVSEWSDCSEQCGEGIQTRQAHCMGPSGSLYTGDVCQPDLRPDTTQRCSSRQACRPLWHASRWTECSTDCGEGLRIRNVFCATYVNGQWETATESMCNATIKLPTSELCNNGPCVGATWLTGPWAVCSAKCGGGQRTRQIMCFGEGSSLDDLQCDALTRPVELESCNTQPCGEEEEGCGRSAYGCCPDEITAATGLNQAGCEPSPTQTPTTEAASTSVPRCADAAFGCCANGIDAATGPDYQGCREGEPQETCELAQDAGPCFAYVLKWYYDVSYQRCANFWYGGCEGNANRFDSLKECQSACTAEEPMTQEEMCSLPIEAGPCKENILSYYYNTGTGRCENFTYGGCHGNMNKFRSLEECDIKCGSMSKDPCTLHHDSGNCFETQPRWFYDVRTQQCEQFNYTGCLGNPNRFDDAASCEERCAVVEREPTTPETDGVVVDVCGLPREAGPCRAIIPQWFYNTDLNTCQQFEYGGCQGNDNRFDTESDCRQACVSFAAEECSLPIQAGPCESYLRAWGYNATVGACQPFVYGGCQGNDNRFDSQEACNHQCGPNAVTKCHLSRTYATYLSQGRPGVFIPQCTLEGYFESIQCHGSSGYCWCVDMDGLEVSGTRRAPGHHVQRPDCQEFRPRELSTCQRHLKQVQGKDGLDPPGLYAPQCGETGEYLPIQCYGSTGYCWCVNDNGEEIDGTRTGPGMGMPNCAGGPQGPCPILVSQIASGAAVSDFQPVCSPDGLFVRVQCDGVSQCLCVNETSGDVLKVLNEAPQDGDFDACNDAHEELTRCQEHRESVLAREEPVGHIRYVPECTEAGDYRQVQCYGDTGHCWCVNSIGEEIEGTRKRPGQGDPDCTVRECHVIRDEAESSGQIGGYIPQCTEEGVYTPTQCHGGTGYCWCVNEKGEELAETRRGPGEERIVCEDVCSLPVVTGPCYGYFPVFGFDATTGTCNRFIYGGCQGNGNRFHTQQACLEACADVLPVPSSASPGETAASAATTNSPDIQSTLGVSSSSPVVTTTLDVQSTATTAPPSTPATPTAVASDAPSSPASSQPSSTESLASTAPVTPVTVTPSTAPELSAGSSAPPSSVAASTPSPDSTPEGPPSTTPELSTPSGSMCRIRRQEALANTLPGVFVPQCQDDGSFLPKQCYRLIGVCWCVHQDGIEQGGTRKGIDEPLDCTDVCSMPEFRGQCPENIQKWFFNAEAGVCETFIYSGCQGNLNQFDDQESCERKCFVPPPTTCPEKREMALATGLLGEFVPQCTADGRYTPQQCHGSIGHCWCVDEEGMELGATRRGPGEELLDCLDVCRLPKYSGPCKGASPMWYYDVMDERCQTFVYGGCQGNGNRFESQAECEQACHIPELTRRPPTACEIEREEALTSDRLDLFVPQCTGEGAYEDRQCYDLIGQCWCANEDGEVQGGTKTREGQVPLDCNDKCSFPKFAGTCLANIPKWFYSMETMSCEEFVYGGCGGNMNQFDSREECQQACLPQGHGIQSCHVLMQQALDSNLPDAFVPQCTEDGWFTSRQCHDSTGQCWCVTESGMEQGNTRRERGMPLLDCDDVCSFPQSTGPCLSYFAMWYFSTEEQACQQFIFGGCQGNGNRFESEEECQQSCMAQEPMTPEPAQSLCSVTRKEAMLQDVIGNFVPQCTPEGLFVRLQCHGSTGYCWCVDEMTGEEMVDSVPRRPGVEPDCDVYYQNNRLADAYPVESTSPEDEAVLSPNHHPLGDEGCATSTFGCCPDGVTQASREDHMGCPGVTPPMVEVAPSDSTVVLGGTLSVTCHAQGNPAPVVTWHRHEAVIEGGLDARVSVTEDGTLVIEDVTEEDSGPYVCRATNGIGQAAKVAVDVDVFTPVQIAETSQHTVRAKEGDVIELYCQASGNPRPVVTWRTGVAMLPGNDPRMTQLEDDTLRIENVHLGDAGNYVCTGRNMFGVVQKRTVTLTIEAEVQIVTLPVDTTANVGATIRLSCGSTGSPKPTTRWTVNYVGLPPMDRFEFMPTGDLIINDVRSTDAGTYTCTAANGLTSQKASATVTVTGANSDPNCQDNTQYANCRVVLRANFCHRSPYDVYCCATCKDNQIRGQRRRRRR